MALLFPACVFKQCRLNDVHIFIFHQVAAKLDDIYKTGKLAHVELDERALDALKEFPVEGALNVLSQFLESNLEHVSNKSAFLCGVMKTYRQKSRASQQGVPTPTTTVPVKGPDEEKIKKILERTHYTLDVTTGEQFLFISDLVESVLLNTINKPGCGRLLIVYVHVRLA